MTYGTIEGVLGEKIERWAKAGAVIAIDEAHAPRVTHATGTRGRRPAPTVQRSRKYCGVDCGVDACLFDNAAQLLDIGQPPVTVTGEAGTLGGLQCCLPGVSLATAGAGCAIPVLSQRAAHPYQSGFVVRDGAVIMLMHQ
jgi:hypothetical protein